ncbi:large conductance mechanosensitive channel protein MscL [Actinophytocola sp.]|uniref:large conductance mechanosensitive channel protein MscL n=1 Tax=Actinophytocola sp. TaxID=1872138 RepID=UPI002D7F748F|nr:large conductance mechanosensitive channel protein MscL [Actinophytocola sp.]HET9140320.1 large conductance mechanosensitive channel protein MscL [Actinophytocola sp.]
MLKGFKEFIMRGNVIDLAVAVVIGTAFTGVVTAIVERLINPLVAAFGGGNEIGWAVQLVSGNPKTVLDFGAILTAVITFLTVALVIYFVIVLPMKKLEERRARGEEPPPNKPSDTDLLIEIRDLLREQQQLHQPAPRNR